ncbi:hypothetical protein AB6A40_003088 [Gnathostoma spinigerum]|uniref:SSD domain-containing protein n=1 Tax=Gnathostoma spinigerum TaxID=75299 RepID=A0ABD6E8I5_9BILA
MAYDLMQISGRNTSDTSIVLSYPNAMFFGHRLYLEVNFIDVELNEKFWEEGELTAIRAAKVIALFYVMEGKGYSGMKHLQVLEEKILQHSVANNFSELFNYRFYGDQAANAEIAARTGDTGYHFMVGIILMIVYVSYIMRTKKIKCQIMLTAAAVISPLMSTVLSLALIGWMGIAYRSILILTPVLVLAVGVDDAFLIYHNWIHNRKTRNPSERLALVVRNVGPSIFITSATNMTAFGLGYLSPCIMLKYFCLCTSMAVCFDFILELTVFASTLVIISAIDGDNSEHELIDQNDNKSITKEQNGPKNIAWMKYSEFVISDWGLMSVAVTLSILYIIAYFGVSRMKTVFNPMDSFAKDSSFPRTVELVTHVYKEYAPLNFVVCHPPNISDPEEFSTFMEMVHELQSLPNSYGPERTRLWLNEYIRYFQEMAVDDKHNRTLSYELVPQFLKDKMMHDYKIVRYHIDKSGSVIVDSFIFIVTMRGREGWNQRAQHGLKVREKIGKYQQFDVTMFDYDATIFDIILTIKTEMIRAAIVTFICMLILCAVFTPNLFTTCFASLSILSIFFCLLGLLGWSGLNFDPITMVDVLMAIGLSVDYTAHICYHFKKCHISRRSMSSNEHNDELLRVKKIFETIGGPMIEASISTLICVLPLFATTISMISVFVSTVSLVTVLGIFHGIYVLPVLLSVHDSWIRRKNRKQMAEQKEKTILVRNENSKPIIRSPR